jgi:hypothetical protein
MQFPERKLIIQSGISTAFATRSGIGNILAFLKRPEASNMGASLKTAGIFRRFSFREAA